MTPPWKPYAPTPAAPWDVRRVVRLHRRAGFAATWKEIQRDLKDGPRSCIDRLLAGKSCCQGVQEEFASFSVKLANLAVQANDTSRLQAWWFYRMLFGPDPLTEPSRFSLSCSATRGWSTFSWKTSVAIRTTRWARPYATFKHRRGNPSAVISGSSR